MEPKSQWDAGTLGVLKLRGDRHHSKDGGKHTGVLWWEEPEELYCCVTLWLSSRSKRTADWPDWPGIGLSLCCTDTAPTSGCGRYLSLSLSLFIVFMWWSLFSSALWLLLQQIHLYQHDQTNKAFTETAPKDTRVTADGWGCWWRRRWRVCSSTEAAGSYVIGTWIPITERSGGFVRAGLWVFFICHLLTKLCVLRNAAWSKDSSLTCVWKNTFQGSLAAIVHVSSNTARPAVCLHLFVYHLDSRGILGECQRTESIKVSHHILTLSYSDKLNRMTSTSLWRHLGNNNSLFCTFSFSVNLCKKISAALNEYSDWWWRLQEESRIMLCFEVLPIWS